MKHCMMNNTGDNMSNMSNMNNMENMNDSAKAARMDNMEINEQGVDNGAMWEAEPVVVLPPNTPPSIQPQRISDIEMPQNEGVMMRGSACADGTPRAADAVPARAAASVARRNRANNTMNNMPAASTMNAVPSQTLNISTSPRATDTSYLQGYLQQHLGKYVQIYFVVGTQQNAQRDGILNEIGTNFLVIREIGSNRLIVCDLYSVKFVNIYDLCEEDLRML